MKTLSLVMKNALSALAYSDAAKLKRQDGAAPKPGLVEVRPVQDAPLGRQVDPDAPIGRRGHGQVALCLDERLSGEVMDYVISTCQRLGASVVAFATAPQVLAAARMEPYWPALARAGIEWRIETLAGDFGEAVIQYVRAHPQVLFLICESHSPLAHTLVHNAHRDGQPALTVPVVMMAGRHAAQQPGATQAVKEVDWLHPALNRGF